MARLAKKPKVAPDTIESIPPDRGQTISFEYIKSGLFRVIHADGAIGAITPSGNMHMAFYSERPAIPNITVHKVSDEGLISSPISTEKDSKCPYIREIDVDIIFDVETVESLIEFLRGNLEEMKQRREGTHSAKKNGRD